MDTHVGASTITAASTPPSPPSDPLGSIPEESLEEIASRPTDEDQYLYPNHEHENGEGKDPDENQDQENSLATVVLTDDLKSKIIKQAEYYFSNENLQTDRYMLGLIKKNKAGFVPISVITSFKKMKKLTRNSQSIVAALKESSLLVLSSDGNKVRRCNPLPMNHVRDQKLFTVLVEHLPLDHSEENIRRIFGEVGQIRKISVNDPHVVEDSKKSGRADILISSKLHALVEYETMEAAEKAVATLNDEGDWRNGLRVKLLKQMAKYGQQRQGWRGSHLEKNNNGRASDHIGNEEKNTSSEPHEDVSADEEDAEHLSKEKNENRGRNRGRARRQKTRGTSQTGHGTSSSAHAIEPPKPPPGPRMPDGTRGFTMGRGRPLVS